jgi:hypothetical protein
MSYGTTILNTRHPYFNVLCFDGLCTPYLCKVIWVCMCTRDIISWGVYMTNSSETIGKVHLRSVLLLSFSWKMVVEIYWTFEIYDSRNICTLKLPAVEDETRWKMERWNINSWKKTTLKHGTFEGHVASSFYQLIIKIT